MPSSTPNEIMAVASGDVLHDVPPARVVRCPSTAGGSAQVSPDMLMGRTVRHILFSTLSAVVCLALIGCDCGGQAKIVPAVVTDGGDVYPALDAGALDASVRDASVAVFDAGGGADASVTRIDAGPLDASVIMPMPFDGSVGLIDAGPIEPDAGRCTSGEVRCEGGMEFVCSDGGLIAEAPDSTSCAPGTLSCGTCRSARVCRSDGGGFDVDHSLLGCEFYPTLVARNSFETAINGEAELFGLVFSNPGTATATVTITGGSLAAPIVFSAPPDFSTVRTLQTKTPGLPYRVVSTAPISVTQFKNYVPTPTSFVRPGDGSQLRGTHRWGHQYFVSSWPNIGILPTCFTIVANETTLVRINSAAQSLAAERAEMFIANSPQVVRVDAGASFEIQSSAGDLTGSTIDATRPVQVFGCHYSAAINPTMAIDAPGNHLEESLPPVSALETLAVVVSPAIPTLPGGQLNTVRIVAPYADTHLTYEPAQLGAPTMVNAGASVDVVTQSVFVVQASKPVLVTQFTHNKNGDAMGAPSMTATPLPSEWQSKYRFHAPIWPLWSGVDIVAPTAAAGSIVLDGMAVTGFTPIGASGYSVARVFGLTSSDMSGNHTITGSVPFQISVRGIYSDIGGYWHPGG